MVKQVKSLGIYFGCDQKEGEQQLKKCNDIFNSWNKRNLTILGRITIILPSLTRTAINAKINKDTIQAFK